MTRSVLTRALLYYRKILKDHYAPERAPTDELFDPETEWRVMLKHAAWMVEEALVFVKEKNFEKAFRRLGFVQGVMWSTGEFSIDEMRKHNTEPNPHCCLDCPHGTGVSPVFCQKLQREIEEGSCPPMDCPEQD